MFSVKKVRREKAETERKSRKSKETTMVDTTTTDNTYENTGITAEEKTAEKTAAEEMEVNVSLDQLSYICEYCGKVNAISSPNCVRCGKRRPRSEYLNAMGKMRNADSIKDRYIEEQARLATDRQEAMQDQLVRLVESRVADEKAQILAQEAVKLEQETDDIKRTTARDAVLRIIEAERIADEKVKAAELRAEEAINGRNREIEEQIASEREKVLYAAAKRVISERAGIENAAEERIAAERKSTEQKAQETIANAIDEAEKSAARRAVLKVVAGEQAAEDRARIERDAISRAAMDRVAEEKRIAEINAYSKYKVEREAIERAVDERIKAERELLYGRRGAAQTYGGVTGGNVQPLTIVPYVNSQQPIYQYGLSKTVYRFVPDEMPSEQKRNAPSQIYVKPGKKKEVKNQIKGSGAVKVCSIIAALLTIAVILTVLLSDSVTAFGYVSGENNIDILTSLFIKEGNSFADILPDSGVGALLPSIGIIVMCVGAVACLVCGIIGLISGKANAAFPIFGAVGVIGAALLICGLVIGDIVTASEVFASIGILIALIASVIVLVISVIAAVLSGKAKKKEAGLRQTV